jgi:5-methyltetrahydropteroyltriglutamate--homocysteine methyltransferase
MLTQNLGYPRIGAGRELKKACENYWAGQIGKQELLIAGKNERQKNWKLQQEYGIDLIPCNDFSFYDQVQDLSLMLGAVPERFEPLKKILNETDLYFAMCRGYQKNGLDIIAMEMTKWFDTNYHYIVPEFVKTQKFELTNTKIVDEFIEARNFGVITPKPVLIGPVSYILLGKEKGLGFNRLELIDRLIPVYEKILRQLSDEGCQYLQLDEPFLVTDLTNEIREAYKLVYGRLSSCCPSLKIILASYFGDLDANTDLACQLPVHTLHIDLVRGKEQLDTVLEQMPSTLSLSLGVIDGRNIWKNDYSQSLSTISKASSAIGEDKIMLAPSCSLLHCPYDLDMETGSRALPNEIKYWMAFAKQKLKEIEDLKLLTIKTKHNWSQEEVFINNQKAISDRKTSPLVHNTAVQEQINRIDQTTIKRNATFEKRINIQNEKLKLPLFPTTTIGSFPQTGDVRKMRRAFRKGDCTEQEYDAFLKREIEKTIKWQEEIGIDVLVHGEYERNDMVEYFGEKLEGFAFTQNGWVQSYGTRGVKPPVIFGDVSRKKAMTVKWSEYAQSLTGKKVKGMLTGPVTILQWSFVRNDQPREDTTFQIALALRQEVSDLEKAGINIIQIDEPALREGLPLKTKEWQIYLDWAVKAFKICSSNVSDETQIHTHMCYAEFNDIIESIAAMDADVISIETSRSQMELLKAFKNFKYPNQIGPGVYDIHSPRTPFVKEMKDLIEKAIQYIPPKNIWVNPDCGLKTRKWEEVKPALINMVKAAQEVREAHS